MLIAGGFLVLAIVALFIRPKFEPLAVSVLGKTEGASAFYRVEVSNVTHRSYVFRAEMEYETNGLWKRVVASNRTFPPLKGHDAQVFILPKPDQGKGRVSLLYGPVTSGNWEHWRDSLRALAGFYAKPEKMFIEAP